MATTSEKNLRDYRDVDFSFLPHPETKNVLVKTKINAIKQSIINLMTLKRNDKPFHPEIASPIYEFLFDNVGVIEQLVLESAVTSYLKRYEPRAKIISVDINVFHDTIDTTITFTALNVTEPFTVNFLINRLR